MITEWNEEVAIALALPLLMVVIQVVHTLGSHHRTLSTAQCVARITAMIVAREEPADEAIRRLRLRFSNRTILDSVILISHNIYGRAALRLSLIVEVCEIGHYLQNRLQSKDVRKRTALLAQLTQLSNEGAIIDCIDYGTTDIGTLNTAIALIATKPERAIHHIANIKSALSLYDVALLSQMIYRADTPIAYTPLLCSENRNLQLVGIYLCELLSIADAEHHLQHLVGSADREISLTALGALCSLRGNLNTTQVEECVTNLAPPLRASFIRHAVGSCYSLRSCSHLLSSAEALQFSQRLDSYKSQILCS